MAIKHSVPSLVAVTALIMVASARPGRSAETPRGESAQTRFSAWVSDAEEAAKKAASQASIAATEAEKALRRAGVEVSNAAARASRTAAAEAATAADRAEAVAARAAADAKQASTEAAATAARGSAKAAKAARASATKAKEWAEKAEGAVQGPHPDKEKKMPYQTNIVSIARANQDFRRVVFTGTRSQLVVMSIPPKGEVGQERHDRVEQTLFCLSGSGTVILEGARSSFNPGDVVVVTPGTLHNFINTGTEPLKIYTIYAPANHIDGRIHHTKADADADHADEEFGHKVGG